MGHDDPITPDVVEWLLSDSQVVSRWRNLGERLGLTQHVAVIDGSGGSKHSYFRQRKSERQKMKELFDLWKVSSDPPYTRGRLLEALRREGMTDMHRWLQLMGTEGTREEVKKRTVIMASYGDQGLHRSHGILKNKRSYSGSESYSDYFSLGGSNSSTGSHDDATSRESTPDIMVHGQSSKTHQHNVRFADDVVVVSAAAAAAPSDTNKASSHTSDINSSVQRYFDDLISMIEEAAEGLWSGIKSYSTSAVGHILIMSSKTYSTHTYTHACTLIALGYHVAHTHTDWKIAPVNPMSSPLSLVRNSSCNHHRQSSNFVHT